MQIKEHHIRDWKHLWLHSIGWNKFAVWKQARWNPLTAEEKIAFVLEVAHTDIEHSFVIDEFGDLVDDRMLSIEAYRNDPEVPTYMLMPYAQIDGEHPWAT